MFRFADLLEKHNDGIVALETWDNGKPYEQLSNIEIPMVTRLFQYYAGWANKIHSLTIPEDGPYHVQTLNEPIGIADQIIPWNFPLLMYTWKVGPALSCGNTVELKPKPPDEYKFLVIGCNFLCLGNVNELGLLTHHFIILFLWSNVEIIFFGIILVFHQNFFILVFVRHDGAILGMLEIGEHVGKLGYMCLYASALIATIHKGLRNVGKSIKWYFIVVNTSNRAGTFFLIELDYIITKSPCVLYYLCMTFGYSKESLLLMFSFLEEGIFIKETEEYHLCLGLQVVSNFSNEFENAKDDIQWFLKEEKRNDNIWTSELKQSGLYWGVIFDPGGIIVLPIAEKCRHTLKCHLEDNVVVNMGDNNVAEIESSIQEWVQLQELTLLENMASCDALIIQSMAANLGVVTVIRTTFALNMLFHIPVWIGVLLTWLSTLVLLALQQYGVRKLEFLIAFLVFTIVACFLAELGYAKPNASEVLYGLFVSQLKGSGSTLLVISILGAMVMPHNLFLHSALVLSRKIPKSVNGIKEACRFYTIESGLALVVAYLINVSVISVGL